MGERGGLRNASFSWSFCATTTARASRVDFRISTSLSTIESAWTRAGRSLLVLGEPGQAVVEQDVGRGRVDARRGSQIGNAQHHADCRAQDHDLDLPTGGSQESLQVDEAVRIFRRHGNPAIQREISVVHGRVGATRRPCPVRLRRQDAASGAPIRRRRLCRRWRSCRSRTFAARTCSCIGCSKPRHGRSGRGRGAVASFRRLRCCGAPAPRSSPRSARTPGRAYRRAPARRRRWPG